VTSDKFKIWQSTRHTDEHLIRYVPGEIEIAENYCVTVGNQSEVFATLDDAERFLWTAYAQEEFDWYQNNVLVNPVQKHTCTVNLLAEIPVTIYGANLDDDDVRDQSEWLCNKFGVVDIEAYPEAKAMLRDDICIVAIDAQEEVETEIVHEPKLSDLPERVWYVETATLCDGYVNCWHVTDEHGNESPMTFETLHDAEMELHDFGISCRDAGMDFVPTDYRIVYGWSDDVFECTDTHKHGDA
jgi:hypothetical protein